MHVLITGAAGFIGAALAQRLVQRGTSVLGVDHLSDYYDVALKQARLAALTAHADFTFVKQDLADRTACAALFREHTFDIVVHLAAQAGVRYSMENPPAYVDANLVGFANLLEGCRDRAVPHLIYASSSSVYGTDGRLPLAEDAAADHPVSLYAATKRANELMAHSYAHLYGIPCTGLRFFTVYGPWGRPDMAFFHFTRRMLAGEPIPVYNGGRLSRDFTYIDDTVEAVLRVLDGAPPEATGGAAARVYNIGNGRAVPLMDYIHALEHALGVTAEHRMLPMQPGDVAATHADMTAYTAAYGFAPSTPVEDGLAAFAAWYRDYYRTPA